MKTFPERIRSTKNAVPVIALSIGSLFLGSCTNKSPSPETAPAVSTTIKNPRIAIPITPEPMCKKIVFEAGESPYSEAEAMVEEGYSTPASSERIIRYAKQIMQAVDRDGIEIVEGATTEVCFNVPGDK